MSSERVKLPARMLPNSAPLVPMKPQTPQDPRQVRLPFGRDSEPNPLPHDLGQLVLLRQLRPQVVQNLFGG